jgi:hypothetical protein
MFFKFEKSKYQRVLLEVKKATPNQNFSLYLLVRFGSKKGYTKPKLFPLFISKIISIDYFNNLNYIYKKNVWMKFHCRKM